MVEIVNLRNKMKGYVYCEVCEDFVPMQNVIHISKTTENEHYKVLAFVCLDHVNFNPWKWESQSDEVLKVKEMVEERVARLGALEDNRTWEV